MNFTNIYSLIFHLKHNNETFNTFLVEILQIEKDQCERSSGKTKQGK